MDNSFKNIINQSNNVLVLLPKNARFDQVAAGLGLYLALSGKKEVQIHSAEPMTVDFNRLVGVNKVQEDLGNKNMIITFPGYQAENIERVSYDIDDGEFKLTVIPKSGQNAPQKDQVNFNYSGVSADVVVMVGGANESHFPQVNSDDLKDAKLVHVGLSKFSVKGRQVVSFVFPASSVSEIMAALVHDTGLGFNADIATDLLMGIEAGSNNFTDEKVTADTFAFVSELMRVGGSRKDGKGKVDKESFPPGSIPGETPKEEAQQTHPDQQTLVKGSPQQAQSVQKSQQVKAKQGAGQPQPQRAQNLKQSQQTTQVSQKAESPKQSQKSPNTSDQKMQEVQQTKEDDGKDGTEEPPKDWLEPKIYKGGSSTNKG